MSPGLKKNTWFYMTFLTRHLSAHQPLRFTVTCNFVPNIFVRIVEVINIKYTSPTAVVFRKEVNDSREITAFTAQMF